MVTKLTKMNTPWFSQNKKGPYYANALAELPKNIRTQKHISSHAKAALNENIEELSDHVYRNFGQIVTKIMNISSHDS